MPPRLRTRRSETGWINRRFRNACADSHIPQPLPTHSPLTRIPSHPSLAVLHIVRPFNPSIQSQPTPPAAPAPDSV